MNFKRKEGSLIPNYLTVLENNYQEQLEFALGWENINKEIINNGAYVLLPNSEDPTTAFRCVNVTYSTRVTKDLFHEALTDFVQTLTEDFKGSQVSFRKPISIEQDGTNNNYRIIVRLAKIDTHKDNLISTVKTN